MTLVSIEITANNSIDIKLTCASGDLQITKPLLIKSTSRIKDSHILKIILFGWFCLKIKRVVQRLTKYNYVIRHYRDSITFSKLTNFNKQM